MSRKSEIKEPYTGFEQGPIRPPSEADSLLIRVTRNCPWNRCTFCPVYKKRKFSLRPVDHVIEDIECVYRHVTALRNAADANGRITREEIVDIAADVPPEEQQAFSCGITLVCRRAQLYLYPGCQQPYHQGRRFD